MWQVETLAVTGEDPVTVDDAKQQMRVDHDDEDALIERLVAAATAMVQIQSGRVLRESTLRITFNAFCDPLRLPRAPINEVTSLTYGDTAISDFRFADELAIPTVRPVLDGYWPLTTERAVLVVEAGYPDGEAPAPLIHAILITVAAWFEDRQAGDLPAAAHALIADYRLSWL